MKISTKTLNLLLDSYDFANASSKLPCIKYKRDSIENYVTLAPLAQGAYGDVFVVQHKETKKIYALKRLPKDRIKKNVHSAPFFAERSCLIDTINTRWLVSLHTSFQTLKHIYFLMDFYPGGDLLSLLSKLDVLPESDIRFYAGELILALQELHSLGYVHRDIKPDNILIGSDGHIKLGDFGSCAKTENGVVRSSVSVGTPDYISPEVLCSINSEAIYSYEVDLWSLGVVIYEMVSGYTPFYSTSLTETYKKISKIEYNNNKGSEEVQEVIKSLVCNKVYRKGIEEVKGMKFFVGFNFDGNNEVRHIPDKNWNLNFLDGEFSEGDVSEAGYEGFVGFSYDPNVELDESEYIEFGKAETKTRVKKLSEIRFPLYKKSDTTETSTSEASMARDGSVVHESSIVRDGSSIQDTSNIGASMARDPSSVNEASTSRDASMVRDGSIARDASIASDKSMARDASMSRDASTKDVSHSLSLKKDASLGGDNITVKSSSTLNNELANLSLKNTCQEYSKDDCKILTSVDLLRFKESLWRSKMYLDYIASQNQLVIYYVDHLQAQNQFLKKEIRKKESKIDYENAKFMDDLKKELRQKRGEVKEMQQKIDLEINARVKLEDEIKLLRNKLLENKNQVSIALKEFNCKRIILNAEKRKFDLKDTTIKIHNDKFESGDFNESLSNVFVNSIKENEMFFLGEKKRFLAVKVVFMAEREETSHSNKSEEEIFDELKKEEDILNALEKMINILRKTNTANIENVNMQREGSLKRIEQLKSELRRVKGKNVTKYSTKSDKDNENTNQKEEKSRNKTIKEFNNHSFVTKTFGTQTSCHFCTQLLYGTKDQGYECNECGIITHKNCYVLVKESCEMSKAIKKGHSVLFLMRNLEEKEKLIKIFSIV